MRSGFLGVQPSIKEDGSVRFPGIDFGSRKLTVHHFKVLDILVVKVAGGNCYRGAGYIPSTTYSAASFIVMQWKDGAWWTVVEFPLKKGAEP